MLCGCSGEAEATAAAAASGRDGRSGVICALYPAGKDLEANMVKKFEGQYIDYPALKIILREPPLPPLPPFSPLSSTPTTSLRMASPCDLPPS